MPMPSFISTPVPPRPRMAEREEDKYARCSCGNSFMEEVRVSRYVKHHTVQLGQPIPQVEPVTFILLRCVKCAELYEPNLQLATYDVYRKPYEVFRKEFDEAVPQNTSPDPARPANS